MLERYNEKKREKMKMGCEIIIFVYFVIAAARGIIYFGFLFLLFCINK